MPHENLELWCSHVGMVDIPGPVRKSAHFCIKCSSCRSKVPPIGDFTNNSSIIDT